MQKYSVAILGCGSRGTLISGFMAKLKDKFEIVALCDTNEEQIDNIKKVNNFKNVKTFLDPDQFLSEKYADFLFISTPDREHIPQAVKALNLGYDILLEKPLSDDRDELELLLDTQKKTGRIVVVCHELRYGPGFRKCAELLESGVIGKLYAIDASERVGYVHWAQAYVRGIGASIKRAHPAILAKCSHDLDLIQSYAKSECDTVSSVGDLSFFVPENAPEDSAYRCLDCKHQNTCVYSAKRIYIDSWYEKGKPEFCYPFNKVTHANPHTEESIREGLTNGEYGICAFKCEVDKVDHQFVQMKFKNGVKASLKMVFGAHPGRRITFYGNYGEIIFDERTDNIQVMPYGGKEENISVSSLKIIKEEQSHGGGDAVLVEELYDILSGKKECPTPLCESIECHLMGIAAEESRKCGGALIKVHK